MTITIREAKPDDAALIAPVHVASWRATYAGVVHQHVLDTLDVAARERNWQHNLTQPAHHWQKTFLALSGNELAGFSTAGLARDDKYIGCAELWAIYAAPNFFGKGAGRLLFNTAATYVQQELGFNRMIVDVLAGNTRGRDFYERMGASVIPGSQGRVTIGDDDYPNVKYEWKELRHDQ